MHGSTLTQGRPLEQAMLTASHESAVPRHARSRVSGGACAPGCTPGGISQLMAAVDSDDSVCGRAHANRVLRWSSVSTCARAPRMRRRARPVAAPLLCHAGLAAATVLSCVSLLQIGQEARRRGVQRQAAQQQALCTRRTAAAPGAQAALLRLPSWTGPTPPHWQIPRTMRHAPSASSRRSTAKRGRRGTHQPY